MYTIDNVLQGVPLYETASQDKNKFPELWVWKQNRLMMKVGHQVITIFN